ncbi:hypothetical protein GC174_07705 [bacterium]|nr:hypothetical protein [bacterium]
MFIFEESTSVSPVEQARVTDSGSPSNGSGSDLSNQIWSEMQKTGSDSSANGQLGGSSSSDSTGESLSGETNRDSAEDVLPPLDLIDEESQGIDNGQPDLIQKPTGTESKMPKQSEEKLPLKDGENSGDSPLFLPAEPRVNQKF